MKFHMEEVRSPAGRPDFKSGKGCRTVLGGFDSHTLPPYHYSKDRKHV